MKLGGSDRFKSDKRHRRKMPRAVNGENDALNGEKVLSLAATYHDHLSCTKSPDLESAKEQRVHLPCETDHIYANSSSDGRSKRDQRHQAGSRSRSKQVEDKSAELEIEKLKEKTAFLAEQNKIKDQELLQQKEEIEKYKALCEELQSKKCQHTCDSSNPATSSSTVFPTRYFGRKSNYIPSRALKRRTWFSTPSLGFSPKSCSVIRSRGEMAVKKSATPTSGITGKVFASGNKSYKHAHIKSPVVNGTSVDYFTTNRLYHKQSWVQPSPASTSVFVPSYTVNPIPPFYQMEGTEDLHDPIFEKRHQKYFQLERRRKKWDIQSYKDRRAQEKLKSNTTSVQEKSRSPVTLFTGNPNDVEYIEITDKLPVNAFGGLIPVFQDCEFSLPLNFREPEPEESVNAANTEHKPICMKIRRVRSSKST